MQYFLSLSTTHLSSFISGWQGSLSIANLTRILPQLKSQAFPACCHTQVCPALPLEQLAPQLFLLLSIGWTSNQRKGLREVCSIPESDGEPPGSSNITHSAHVSSRQWLHATPQPVHAVSHNDASQHCSNLQLVHVLQVHQFSKYSRSPLHLTSFMCVFSAFDLAHSLETISSCRVKEHL